jgi:hypothetical protein
MKIKFQGKIKDVHPLYAKRLLNSGKAEEVKAGRPKTGKGEQEEVK